MSDCPSSCPPAAQVSWQTMRPGQAVPGRPPPHTSGTATSSRQLIADQRLREPVAIRDSVTEDSVPAPAPRADPPLERPERVESRRIESPPDAIGRPARSRSPSRVSRQPAFNCCPAESHWCPARRAANSAVPSSGCAQIHETNAEAALQARAACRSPRRCAAPCRRRRSPREPVPVTPRPNPDFWAPSTLRCSRLAE